MKILITGANGLLGQKLVGILQQEEDIEALATSRGEKKFLNDINYKSLDIEDKDQVNEVINSFRPDTIIHTAAMTNADTCEQNKESCWKTNVTAVEHLVAAAETNKSFFIYLSTDFVFSGEAGPYSEEDETGPVNYYGKSKAAAEEIVKNCKSSWAIVRTVLVYGINPSLSRSNIIVWVKNSLENSRHIQVVDDQVRSPTLAEDLAAGCLLVAKKKAEGIWHISGKDVLTPYEMAIKTADFFRLDKSFIHRTDSGRFTQPARRPPKTGFVIRKAEDKLGYQPHSFEEGIAILAAQIKD